MQLDTNYSYGCCACVCVCVCLDRMSQWQTIFIVIKGGEQRTHTKPRLYRTCTQHNITLLTVSYLLLPCSANQYCLYCTHTSLAMSLTVCVFVCVCVACVVVMEAHITDKSAVCI